MRKIWAIALSAVSIVALAGAPAFAKPGHGHGEGHGKNKDDKGPEGWGPDGRGPNVEFRIRDADVHIIRQYYGPHGYSSKRLPPGIAKNLERGKPLPPGIAKRYAPRELVSRLPPRAGCDWLFVGPDIVLVERRTGFVVDIALDIF